MPPPSSDLLGITVAACCSDLPGRPQGLLSWFGWMLAIVGVAVALTWAVGKAVAEEAEVGRLIDALGSERAADRDAAGKRLEQVGEPALDALRKAAASNADPDVRLRAYLVIAAIRKGELREVRRFEGHRDIVWAVAFSPDGKQAVSCGGGECKDGQWLPGSDFAVRLWDVAAGKEVRQFKGHTAGAACVAFSPDGRFILSGAGNVIRLWETATGKEVRTLTGHTGGVSSVAFVQDGGRAVSGSWDGTVRLWDVKTGKELDFHHAQAGRVQCVAVSPDGKQVVSGGDDSFVRVWAFQSRVVRLLRGHESSIKAVAFCPDSRHVLSGSWDRTMKLWDVPAGREERSFRGHTDRVECVAVSPDGKRALSGGLDKTVRLWDVATGEELHCYEGHGGPVSGVAFSPDGRFALSASWDHTLRLWRLPAK